MTLICCKNWLLITAKDNQKNHNSFKGNPAGTQRWYNVASMSMQRKRRIDVNATLYKRHVRARLGFQQTIFWNIFLFLSESEFDMPYRLSS